MLIKHELRSNRKAWMIWTFIIALFDFSMMLLYPSLQESMADMAATYEKMGSFAIAFGMDQLNIATPIGFYGMYVGVMLSLCGALYAAILGTGILAKEEGGHTAEYLCTLPMSRITIVCKKVISIVILVIAFDFVNLLFGMLGLTLIDADFELKTLLIYHFGQTVFHFEIAVIGTFISACTRKLNLGLGLGIALLLYFLDMMARVIDQLQGFKYITPYYYSNATDVLTKGKIDHGLLAIGLVVTIACIVLANVIYDRRDLSA